MTTTYPPRAPPKLVEEADIELNAEHFAWTDLDSEGKPRAPLEAVLVHELGHMLGFSDVCSTGHGTRMRAECTEAEQRSVMNPGSRSTELSAFDVERLCAAYPRSVAPQPSVPPTAPWPLFVAGSAGLMGVMTVAWFVMGRRRSVLQS